MADLKKICFPADGGPGVLGVIIFGLIYLGPILTFVVALDESKTVIKFQSWRKWYPAGPGHIHWWKPEFPFHPTPLSQLTDLWETMKCHGETSGLSKFFRTPDLINVLLIVKHNQEEHHWRLIPFFLLQFTPRGPRGRCKVAISNPKHVVEPRQEPSQYYYSTISNKLAGLKAVPNNGRFIELLRWVPHVAGKA
jgi:hypothetical protein